MDRIRQGEHLIKKMIVMMRIYKCENSRQVNVVIKCCCCVCDQVATCVSVSADSSTMACGFADCTIRLYQLDTGKVCRQSDKANCLYYFQTTKLILWSIFL